ncbi:hypothetical protein HA402_001237 [Bradysia odoriphaga]|nr:hypothetical protein HA402_001237 [Bradysia odoriphaga]
MLAPELDPNRSCCDQVLALTSHIEYGFEKCLKTAVVFIDLSSAYDTVWRHGLLLKLVKAIPCNTFISLINEMLSRREFVVYINEERSKKCILSNGLPQGSVLAPLLFNLFISDMPPTASRKFGYADDNAIAVQSKCFMECERTLNKDLLILQKYFNKWGLKPNPKKTESTSFHLNNKQANYQLNLRFCNQNVKHTCHPKYLGITLDRSLTHRKHCENTAAKIKTRNNIIHKLCGTTWGADAESLRTTALALVFSVAEYCCPVWLCSSHTSKVDVQLNETLRAISGSVNSTPLEWLPVLANIAPPDLRRQQALLKEYRKIQQINFNVLDRWHDDWQRSNRDPQNLIENPSNRVPGFNLPRKEWVTLNRFRTGHGRCAYFMYKWGLADNPGCDCGEPNQTMRHIATVCPTRAYSNNLGEVHQATPSVIEWLKRLDLQL